MDEIHQEQVLSFCDMCGCDFDIAMDYLRCCDWSADSAISLFFENGGAPLNLPSEPSKQVKEEEIQEIPSLCEHCQGNVRPLTSSMLVYKEECVYCFSSWDHPDGINVCLSCYLGFCCSEHTQLHTSKTGHSMYLHIHRQLIPHSNDFHEKITKLAINVEGGAVDSQEEYTTDCTIFCSQCNCEFKMEGYYSELAEKVLLRSSAEKEKDVFKWEEENLKPCPHCDSFKLPSPCPTVSTEHFQCSDCDLTRNLWLCLECGEFHCGRKQWDIGAAPGNGHAIEHFKKTGHSLVVKLSSLQENRGDVHCYACDDNPQYNYGDILFPAVFEILKQYGVLRNGKVVGLSKEQQEKTITEMNLMVNQEFEFSMNDASGKAYEPYQGVDSCGLENLGNSCYMNCIIQSLMRMPEVISLINDVDHFLTCSMKNPTECLQCQFIKLMNGFMRKQNQSVRPRMLKQVVGQLAPDFNNSKQQDCYEFFTVLIDLLNRFAGNKLHSLFSLKSHFFMECQDCHMHINTPSDEENCITVQIPTQTEGVESVSLSDLISECIQTEMFDRECPSCHHQTHYTRTPVFEEFPEYLCIRVNRFVIDPHTYAISKNTIPVIPDDVITVCSSVNKENEIPSQQYKCVGACLHRGSKADFGHYIAVVKEPELKEWVMCNDSKVVIAEDAPVNECYLVFYKKC